MKFFGASGFSYRNWLSGPFPPADGIELDYILFHGCNNPAAWHNSLARQDYENSYAPDEFGEWLSETQKQDSPAETALNLANNRWCPPVVSMVHHSRVMLD